MTYSERILADAPTAYYRLGEASGLVAVDAAAVPHNGTIPATGVTYNAPGAVADGSTALTFNGADAAHIDTPAATTAAIDQTTKLTLELWVKPTVNTTLKIPLGFIGESASYIGVQALVPYIVLAQSSPFLQHTLTGGSAPIGVWTHIAMTYDGTTQILYVNGVSVASAVWSHAFSIGGAGMNIGGYTGAGGASFPGGVDEVAIYAVALTAAQVRAHYLAAFTAYAARIMADAPLGYWRLNEPSGLTAADLAGGKNGTIAGGVTLAQPGAVPGDTAMSFNGLTGRVATTLGFPTAQCSAEAWVFRTGGGQGTFPRLLTDAASNSFPFELAITSGTLQFFLQAQGSVWTSSGISIPLNAWVHIVATWDGVVYRIYKDGALAYTNSSFPPGPLVAGATVSWANDNGVTNNAIQATLDEVAIYSYALSPAQVTAHYQARALPFSFGTYPYRVIQDGASNYWRLNETNAGYSAAVLALSPLAYWRFEETGGNRFKDASGNNHTLYSGQTGAAGANVAGVTYRRPAPLRDGSAGLTTLNTQGLGCFPITLTVSPAASSQSPAGTLTVTWAGIPAAFVSAINFVGIARRGNEANQVGWKYLTATASGSMTMAVNENVGGAPYPPGGEAASDYRITLYYNNSWLVLAEIEGFTLTPNPPAGGTLSSPSPVPLTVGATCTFECWLTIRSIAASSYGFICGDNNLGLYVFYDGANYLLALNYAGSNHLSAPLTINVPYHVAVVCVAGAVTFYLNGVASGTAAGWPGFTIYNVINAIPSGTLGFNGDIDELAIYGTALSPATVAAHAAFWTPVAVDSIGGKNGAISGGVALNQPGALGSGDKAMVFDGVNGRIVTAANGVLLPPLTFEAWVRTTILVPMAILGNVVASPANDLFYLAFQSGLCRVDVDYAGGGSTNLYSTTSKNDGQWHHVVGVYEPTTIKLYVDGLLNASATLTAALIGSTNKPLEIGFNGANGQPWNGTLDDIAIYPFALTPAQIAAHYQAGKAGPQVAGIPWWAQIGSEVLLGSV